MEERKYSEEELKKILHSPHNYPLSFPDNIGEEQLNESFYAKRRVSSKDGTRYVTLLITQDQGNSKGIKLKAYLTIYGVSVLNLVGGESCTLNSILLQQKPLLNYEYRISLMHIVSEHETVPYFESKEELIECVKTIFKQCFIGNWSLWVEDSTDLIPQRKLLIPDELKPLPIGGDDDEDVK